MSASVGNLLQESKLVEDAGEYVREYLEKQIHPDAPEDFRVMVACVLMDGFESGAAWADAVSGRDKKLVLTPN